MTGTQPNETAPSIPGFELLSEIGRGGFGRVWLARNQASGVARAVKLIERRATGSADPAGREVVSIARLESVRQQQHPNLLDIQHVGQTDDHVFFVTDLADAAAGHSMEADDYLPATLERRLGDGAVSAEQSLDWARQLLRGLASLHDAGMAHRDVKPANCLFVGGQLKLADFGLLTETDTHSSRIGTQAYMPPDGQMDQRADVYAAGLVIYEMITGYPVERFPQLGDRAGTIAEDGRLTALLKLVLDACQANREERFADAGEMLASLEERSTEGTPSRRRLRRLALASMLGAAVAILAWGGYRLFAPPQERLAQEQLAGDETPRVDVNFLSKPYGAIIMLDDKVLLDRDGNTATTPCTIEGITAGVHKVVYHHPDHSALNLGTIDFKTTREVEGIWDLPPGVSDEPRRVD